MRPLPNELHSGRARYSPRLQSRSTSRCSSSASRAPKFAATAPATSSPSVRTTSPLRGLRITGSGLRLSDDNAAVFVAGNRATIENNVIRNSLHGVYLKKVRDCRVIGNRIRGKTTLLTSIKPIEQTLTAGIGELCETCARPKRARQRNSSVELREQSHLRERNQRYARRDLLFLYQPFAH